MKLFNLHGDHSKNYKTISLTWVEDGNLSWKAKGILCYLTTRPPHWRLYENDLKNRSTNGTISLHSGIKELISKNYIHRVVKRNSKKKISAWGLLVAEFPIEIKSAIRFLIENEKEWEIFIAKNKDEEATLLKQENSENEDKTVEKATLLKHNSIIISKYKYNKNIKHSLKDKSFKECFSETDVSPSNSLFKGILKKRKSLSKVNIDIQSNINPRLLQEDEITPLQTNETLFKQNNLPTTNTNVDTTTNETLQTVESYSAPSTSGFDRRSLTRKIEQTTDNINKAMKEERLKKRRQVEQPLPISPEVQKIWDMWELEGFKLPTPDLKLYNATIKQCNKLLKGKITELTPVPTMEQIQEAFHKFHLSAFDIDFQPAANDGKWGKKVLQKTYLSNFIYNEHAASNPSQLLWWIKNSPLPVHSHQVEDKYPTGTNRIKTFYNNCARGSIREKFTVQELDKFRAASNMCVEFFEKYKFRLRGVTGGYKEIVDMLCNAVWESCGEDSMKIQVGSFYTKHARDRLMAKLQQEGMIEEVRQVNYYQSPTEEQLMQLPGYRQQRAREEREKEELQYCR